MALWLVLNGEFVVLNGPVNICQIKQRICEDLNLSDFYISHNGKIVSDGSVAEGCIHVIPRLRGGKGGFGSMLRAIGAQIEKTTNREACRDLSGRRLRDINEEKRLKNWIAQQAEREREAAERRKKKLERLCLEPKHDFSDQDYEKERSELTEKLYDAVEQGFRSASTSSACPKRKHQTQVSGPPKKKSSCLWVDDIDENDLSSGDSSDSESEVPKPVTVVKCTGNDKDSPGSSHEDLEVKEEKDSENVTVVKCTGKDKDSPGSSHENLEVKEEKDSENSCDSQQISGKTENSSCEEISTSEIVSSEKKINVVG